ncbi:sensor histidine kinase [Tolypothrix sp. FACHB-123]|uniref:sensor histidine kinase n=1 Tax=Tolypothrix sp. FACHB-123 TaxID=2692868 RepID=UPI00168875D7|nr:sensor histidine kinase [Tolypothrix sp. FACHB-123]MBD2357511.1 sensor histidine kinase [Tolypothrix sp. FACHB-123]
MVEELYTPEQLNHMHQQLWQCVLEFANLSATQERNRIARELHDSLGHALTALNFQLQTASKLCKPDPNQAQEFLNEAHRLVAIATQEVRQSVKALRNDPLATQSLESLIESLVRDFHQTTGILPEVKINLPIPLLPHLTAQIYRIIQEALNNIRKYAQATAVQIYLCTTSTGLNLTIQDNGRGFDPEKISGGYGLRGMQERIAVLQGNFYLESQPQAGCCIHVEIPKQISNLPDIPKVSEISDIAIISEISIPQESVALNHNHAVKIGEWQPLNLDEWQTLESQEFIY